MIKPILAIAGLSVLASIAPAQVTKSGSGYLLRVKYTKGQTLKLASTNSVGGPQGGPQGANAMKFVMPITMRIKDVKKDVATVELEIGAAKMGDQVVNPGQKATIEIDNRNQAAGKGTAANSLGAQLPAKTLKVGDTWTSNAPIAGLGSGNQQLKATYKFGGVKKVDGKDVAAITYSVAGAASGSGSMLILVKDGTLFSNTTKLTLNAGGQGPVAVNSQIKRV